jgi:hypothetical protein
MAEIKSKREQIPADAFRASIQSPLRRTAHVATRHSSQLFLLITCFPGPSNPTPVATIQSGRGISHLAFPSSCPSDVGRVGILPSSSGRSQISFLALSKHGCMHRKNTWVRDILHCPHHQHRSETSSSLFFLVLFN